MVVSAVGSDKLGKEILDNLSEKKLNMLIEKVQYPTGIVQVEVDNNGIPCYDIKENVAWDNIPFTDKLKSIAEKIKWFIIPSASIAIQKSSTNRNDSQKQKS